MFLKKFALALLTLSSLMGINSFAQDSDKIFADITKRQGKDFLIGLTAGAAHGTANRIIEKKIPGNRHPLNYMYTYALSHGATEVIQNGASKNAAVIAGHGIGQMLAESLIPNEKGEITLRFNTSLLTSCIAYLLQKN